MSERGDWGRGVAKVRVLDDGWDWDPEEGFCGCGGLMAMDLFWLVSTMWCSGEVR